MALAERRAEVTWTGTLTDGSGTLNAGSGALNNMPVTWASRTQESGGKTSPEELIASAHAACYAMAFSNTLTQAGKPPEQLQVSAVCSLDRTESGLKISTMALEVRGKVPGITAEQFSELANRAEQGCPVSNALRNKVQISVNAQLA